MKTGAIIFGVIVIACGLMLADFSDNLTNVYGENTEVQEIYTPKEFFQSMKVLMSGESLTDVTMDHFSPEEQAEIARYTGGMPLEEYTVNFCKYYGTSDYYEMKASIEDSNPEQDMTFLFLFFEQIAAHCD
jgi:hypothetical protein